MQASPACYVFFILLSYIFDSFEACRLPDSGLQLFFGDFYYMI